MNQTALAFLKELEKNNNREWFHASKGWYEEARMEMEALVNSLIAEIVRFDPSVKYITAKECMFRIFRDVRFSKDKAPYKINFGAWITKSGRKSCGPGYYIHIQPGESFLAAGIYMPDPDTLKKIRNEIYFHSVEFKGILDEPELKKISRGLEEMDKLKLPPKDFPPDFPDIDILKHKHFTLSVKLPEKQIVADGFPVYAAKIYHTMYPLNVFLQRAVEG